MMCELIEKKKQDSRFHCLMLATDSGIITSETKQINDSSWRHSLYVEASVST